MAPAGLHDFLALIEGRPDGEVAHVLAVLTSTAHHIDQHKENQMGKKPQDMNSDELTQEWRETGDRFYAVRDEMDKRFSAYMDAHPITDDELKGGR